MGSTINNLTSEIENIKSLFAQTPEMFCITSGPKHKFEYVNHAHIKALGFDATGMEVRVAQPESVEVHGILDGVYNTGVTASLHEIAVTLGTSVRYFDLTYSAKRDNYGNVNGIMILGNEVTDKVLVDQKIEFERKRMYNFFEQIPAAVAVFTGPDFKFELANKSYQALIGNHRDVIGKPLYEAIPDLTPVVADILRNVIEKNESYTAFEAPFEIDWDNSGIKKTKYINFYYEPLKDIKNQTNSVMVFVYDVTEQVVARDKISKMLIFRDQFLSIASHELKTPLTSLNLQIQSSQRRLAKGVFDEITPENVNALFHKYKKQTDRLIRLVDDMLDMSKINQGKLSFDFKRVELISLIENSYDHIKEHFQNKNTELYIQKGPHGIFGMFDQQRIEQVVINILMNALKYGEGKPVTVQIGRKGDIAEIRFIDNGPGIPTEDLEKIFLKFERVSATAEISGLGLGLYITKEIVEAHQGKIWVESEIGHGATFVIEFPIESN